MIVRALVGLGVALSLTACAAAPAGPFPEPPPPHGLTGPPPAAAAGFQPSAEAIRRHMAFLADDRLQGREAGTPGYDAAAAYVAGEFQKLGLKPAGDAGSYLQQVPLAGYRVAGRGAISLRGAGGSAVQLVPGADFVPAANPLRAETDVSAPVVFVGEGIVAADRGRDDYAGLDVRGKIVAVLAGAPDSFQTEERAHFSSPALKREEAASRGAVGVITIPRRGAAVAPAPAPAAAPTTGPAPGASPVPAAPPPPWSVTWRDASGTPAFRGGSAPPLGTLTQSGAAKLFAGAPTTLQAVWAAAARPEGAPPRFALPVTATAAMRTEITSLQSANVAGMIEGSDPALRGEVVVLTAHLDHIGIRPAVNGDTIANGALDNASGIATMLEVARGFREAAQKPRRSMLFLAVTAEEKGLIGSDYYARNPTVPKESIVANVNLDMPILTYEFSDVVAFGAERSSIGPAVRRAAARVGVGVIADPLPEEGLFTRSDHYRFVEQGVPSVFLMMGFGNGGEQVFRGFLARCYHQVCDDLSQPISYEAGARFARLNYEIARELVDADQRPAWNPGDFFGNLFGRRAGS